MQDGIIKGTGNSRYLKSISNFLQQYPTYQDFVAALVAGTLPIDLNGINETGWDQLGTALNKANLLSDETAALLGLPNTAVPDDAFQLVPGVGDIVASTRLSLIEGIGSDFLPCNEQILEGSDYPLYFEREGGPITGYEWTKLNPTGWPSSLRGTMMIQLLSGRLLYAASTADFSLCYIYSSDDFGQTWTLLYTTASGRGGQYPSLFQKNDGTILFFTDTWTFESTDNGASWSAAQRTSGSTVYQTIELKNGRILSRVGSSAYFSDDNGKTFSQVSFPEFYGIEDFVVNDAGDIIFIQSESSGSSSTLRVYVSSDNGTSASKVGAYSASDSESVYCTHVISLNGIALGVGPRCAILISEEGIFPIFQLSTTSVSEGSWSGRPILSDGRVLHYGGYFMTYFDGSWIEESGKSSFSNMFYLQLSNGNMLAFRAISYDNVDLYQSQPANVIVSPYKPGFFVRVK